MERTDYNGELRLSDVGREVKLVGWVSTRRRLGAIEFIDLRDNTGIVQLMIKEGVEVPDVRNEYVISVTGTVSKKEVPNPKLPTGDIEVIVKELKVVNKAENPPFIIADKTDALEETRLQYRYLDLRRPEMQRRLRVRAKIVQLTHEYLDKNRFLEVETPILNLATPEGARDYIVPSRLHHGSFYALPQSPQLFKQLLVHLKADGRFFEVDIVISDPEGQRPKALRFHHAPDIFGSVRIDQNVVVTHFAHPVFRIEVLQYRTLEGHVPDSLLFKPVKDRFSVQIEERILL